MTKEEILDKHHNLNLGMLSITEKQIQSAMDDYAKQEAIAFAEWISTHELDFQPASDGRFIGLDMVTITPEQLYSLFLEQK